MSEYDHEPVRGMPEALPADERIIWQGAPDWKRMVMAALHVRLALLYFAVIAAVSILRADLTTAAAMCVFATVVTGLFALFAYGVERTTVYTLTNKRIVLRIGVALNKCINIPLGEIETANLKPLAHGSGNIVVTLKGAPRLGYLMLWPHVRSLRIVRPQPMLRAIPDAGRVAALLFDAAGQIQQVVRVEGGGERSTAAGLPA